MRRHWEARKPVLQEVEALQSEMEGIQVSESSPLFTSLSLKARRIHSSITKT